MNYFEPNKLLNYDNESIINEIKRVYFKYFKNKRMRTKEFSQYSRVSVDTIIKRFGSWISALQEAQIYSGEKTIEKKKQIAFSEIKKDLERVIKIKQGKHFSYKFYKQNGGKYSYPTIIKRFGYDKWNDLLYKEFSLFRIVKIITLKQKKDAISEIELFNEIKNVWDKLGRRPTYSEFKKISKIGIKAYEKRYGTWTKTIECFCLVNENYKSSFEGIGFNTTKELLIQELKQIIKENNLQFLNQDDYKKYGGKYSIQTYYNHFGSWKNAKIAAGLRIGRAAPDKNELFDELQRVWEQLGRQPLHNEIKKLSKYSHKSYSHKFGSWTKAIYAFIADRQGEEAVVDWAKNKNINSVEKVKIDIDISNHTNTIQMKTPRIPSTRLRFRILQRDNFTCVRCGRSPTKDKTIVLHIDHRKPYSKGGETVFDNLETLCSKCNIGKSDLEY